MANETFYKGQEQLLYLIIDGVEVPVGCLTENSFSEQSDTIETTTIDNQGWKTSRPINQSYSISFTGLQIVSTSTKYSFNTLKGLKRNRTPVEWKTITDDGLLSQYGVGYITSLSEASPVGDFLTFDGNIEGYGTPADLPGEYADYLTVAHLNVLGDGSEVLQGLGIGNSLMAGTGATGGILFTMPRVVGQKLYDHFGTGDASSWTPTNYGVGGSSTATAIGYIANRWTSDAFQKGNVVTNKDNTYCLVLTLRNDVTLATDTGYFGREMDIIFTNCKKYNIQPILITDFPKTNMTTGVIEDLTNDWDDYYQVALSSARTNGASIVDYWAYLKSLYDGGTDLRDYTADGTHPNDDGYDIMADMVYECLIAPSITRPITYDCVDTIYSVYEADSGDVTTTSTFAGLTTLSTTRQAETGETTDEAFQLADTETISFYCDAPCKGFTIHTIEGAGSGSLTATFVYASAGGTMNVGTSTVREFSHFVMFATTFAQYKGSGNLEITSTGNCKITGVSFYTEIPNGTFDAMELTDSSGNITTGTMPDGEGSQIMSSEDDYMEFEVTGTTFGFDYKRGVAEGKFEYSVDGGTATEKDCYVNAADTQSRLNLDLGTNPNKTYTIRFTVLAKNPSSSSEEVEVGDFKLYTNETIKENV